MPRQRSRFPALLLLAGCTLCTAASAAPMVVATIPPLHGLAASVTDGVSMPVLLLSGAASPHGHALRPSQARALGNADLVLWIGRELEESLAKSLIRHGSERLLTISSLAGLERLPPRSGGVRSDAHDHTPRGGALDPHVWLAPANARVIVSALTRRLATLDPTHAPRYRANAQATLARIEAIEREIETRLAPVRGERYVVFHDAYQYFEARFLLGNVGTLALHPERSPGVRRIRALRRAIAERGVRCVFSEPQFEPRLVRVLIEGTSARAGTLDPLGARLEPGPEAWFELMHGLAASLVQCLTP